MQHGVPQSVDGAYNVMLALGDNYGEWLQHKVTWWEQKAEEIRTDNSKWGEQVHHGVASVLRDDYHPAVHIALLQAAGLPTTIVNDICFGLPMWGLSAPSGLMEDFPPLALEQIQSYEQELFRASQRSWDHFLHIMRSPPPEQGAQEVLDQTR